MSFSKLSCIQLTLFEPHTVDVEVDISRGLNSFSIVGLPDKAVEEAKDRISAAIKNSGFDSPKSKNHRIVISLAPAELRKEGSNFDLAMALAYLIAMEEIDFDSAGMMFLGELSLDGVIRKVKGILPLVIAAKRKGIKEIFIPLDNWEEASIIEGITIYPAHTLKEIISHLTTSEKLNAIKPKLFEPSERPIDVDFKEVKGQEVAKRALEIAAVGGHNIMLYGPPGTGKTMLARAFVSLLPELSFDDMLEVTTIHSVNGSQGGLIAYPPFRAPHHSASYTAMVGGGNHPKPGEVTLSHKGVLYMDEFPEFGQHVIDSLRQPLEDKVVQISRARSSMLFPSDFILLASMNPCPCGFKGSIIKKCLCSNASLLRYQRKIPGPIMDRIDMWVEVSEVDYKKLGSRAIGESTNEIRKRVKSARMISISRPIALKAHPILSNVCRNLLDISSETLHLSARGYHKIIRLARTIADLGKCPDIEENHILEALQYRPKL